MAPRINAVRERWSEIVRVPVPAGGAGYLPLSDFATVITGLGAVPTPGWRPDEDLGVLSIRIDKVRYPIVPAALAMLHTVHLTKMDEYFGLFPLWEIANRLASDLVMHGAEVTDANVRSLDRVRVYIDKIREAYVQFTATVDRTLAKPLVVPVRRDCAVESTCEQPLVAFVYLQRIREVT